MGKEKKIVFFFFDVKEKNQKETTAWYFCNPNFRLPLTVLHCKNKGGFLVSSSDDIF